MSEFGGGGRATIVALLVPARGDRPCRVLRLRVTAPALSDAIGGGLLDDAAYGVVGSCDLSTEPPDADHGGYCLYLDENRAPSVAGAGLPYNDRAEALAAGLGWQLRTCPDLRGDLLITGATSAGRDVDVPAGVLTAAARAGLIELQLAASLTQCNLVDEAEEVHQ